MEGLITLSAKEWDRAKVIQRVAEGGGAQAEAAERLGVSLRHVRRLLRRYRDEGAEGLASRRRGCPSSRKIADSVREQALDWVRTRYADFGPTHAHEKLREEHGFTHSVETLRTWMVQDGLWKPKSRRAIPVHQHRPRRSLRGEMIQVDGSAHDWFEGRSPTCTLLCYIDDATSEIMLLRLVPAESTRSYMESLREYLERYGRPGCLYTDRHSTFQLTRAKDPCDQLTQFGRVLRTLDVAPIHALTPQAKGRVERCFRTLQSRLVREMRLAGLDTPEEANPWLDGFRLQHNAKFAKAPAREGDAHRPVERSRDELDLIFTRHHDRRLSKQAEFRFKNGHYQVVGEGKGYRLRNVPLQICEDFDGQIRVFAEGRELQIRRFASGPCAAPVVHEKTLSRRVDRILKQQEQGKLKVPAVNHPWRELAYMQSPDSELLAELERRERAAAPE